MKKVAILCLVLGILLASSAVWAASITIDVTAGANATSHRIEKKVGAGAYATLTTLTMPTVQYVDSGVTVGNIYYYRAVAINEFGESAASPECSKALIAAGPPVISCGVNP